MCSLPLIPLAVRCIALMLACASCLRAEALSRLSSRFLARGEQALLEVVVVGDRPAAAPIIAPVAGIEIRQAGAGVEARQLRGRPMEAVFSYFISSYDMGSHRLPAIEVVTLGGKARTEPIDFVVFNPDELQWSETQSGESTIRYASAMHALNRRPYDGESIPVEIKIYVPRGLLVEDWGIPDFQRDGVTAWRFQPSLMRGQVNLLGQPFAAMAYPSVMVSTRPGPVGIGPANLRLMTVETIMDGILQRVSREINLKIPRLDLDAQPLPANPPLGFENAVGSFTMDVTASVTELQEGDPVPLEITVRGSGNLDTLRPPATTDSDGWKIYEATPEPRGDERRELAGRTVFHQFIRALEMKSAVPPFRLVYFDPAAKEYRTLQSQPIPLRMTPAPRTQAQAVGPPEARSVPVERMADILGPLRGGSLTERGPGPVKFAYRWHVLGGILAMVLLMRIFYLRFARHWRRSDEVKARHREWRDLRKLQNAEARTFLLGAGRFIERWHGGDLTPSHREVLAERDASCFKPHGQGAGGLDRRRRAAILRLLRQAAGVLLMVLGLGWSMGNARADELAARALEAYDAARYEQAMDLWLSAGRYDELSANTLYNIGNACYRSGSAGHAALYYRRALARQADHPESRQNLEFIERKYGSIVIKRPIYQMMLARWPLERWQALAWMGLWSGVLGALLFPATGRGSRVRWVGVAGIVGAALLAPAGFLAWHYYPGDATFAPLIRQAVVVADKGVLHVDAARTSPEVIDAPPGSLCEILSESGRWYYVGFARKTRGWIPAEAIEAVIPRQQPSVPRIPKPQADGKSA